MLKLGFEAVLDWLKTCAKFFKCALLILDSIIILLKLSIQECRVFFFFFVDDLSHLFKYRVVFLIQSRFVEAEVFMVKD